LATVLVAFGREDFMNRLFSFSKWVVVGAMAATTCLQASAGTLFQNTTTDAGEFTPGSSIFGNEVIPDSAGFGYALTNLSFEFYAKQAGSFTGPGNMGFFADVRLYLNNGPSVSGAASPGTLVYDSGNVEIDTPTAGSTLDFKPSDFAKDAAYYSSQYGGLLIPAGDLTWTVQFSNLAGGDSAGVEFFNGPRIGSEYDDYWLSSDNGVSWSLLSNGAGENTAGLQIQGTIIPEPGILTLVAMGGLGLLTVARRFPRK
jgi:hypothetical protein